MTQPRKTPSAHAPTIPRSVNTTQPENSTTAPKLPHERDESVDMTHGEPSEAIRQAYTDIEHGLQDTDARDESGRPLDQESNAPLPESSDR